MSVGGYERTKKGLRNSFVAVSFQLISILVGFFARKIFIDYLGTEVLGLNTTAQSLLGFLNLAELGIGAAITVTLYKPLYEGDRDSVREIIALQGWLYKRIAAVIIAASAVMMCFFPLIFAKSELPVWYAYLSFGVMLFSSLIGYFINYKQIILSANQEDYKIQLSWKAPQVLKFVAQAIAVKYFGGNPFLWWFGLEFAFTVITAISVNRMVYSSAPYLKDEVDNPGALREKYPQVITKVKQLFVHKICGVFIQQSSTVILYAFTTLTAVAIYGNYLLITTNLTFLLGSMFGGLSAGLGSVVAEKNQSLINKLFREIYSVRFLVVSVCSICIWFLAQPFVSLWLGNQYVLSDKTLLLIVLNFWLLNMKVVTTQFIEAFGLFQDVLSAAIEATLNIGLSILLGSFWGLNGILVGTAVSISAVHFVWKPYFLFTRGLKNSCRMYVWVSLKHFLVLGVVTAVIFFLTRIVPLDPSGSLCLFLVYAAGMLIVSFALMEGILLATDNGARSFVKRLKKVKS